MSEGSGPTRGPNRRRISPRLARALLGWCLPADSAEDVLGDLEEAFYARLAATDVPSARRWYWSQTLRFLARITFELVFRLIPGRTTAFSRRDAHHLDGKMDLPTGKGRRPRRAEGSSMGTLGQDLRYALRTLAKAPGFTAVVILILGIGIGANTAVFSVLKAAFLQPLPYPEPNELTVLWNRGRDGGRGPASGPDYLDWRSQNSTFEEMGAFGSRQYNLSGDGEPERLHGLFTTGSLWDLLQVQPLVGRRIVASDEEEGNTGVVVLSHALWRRRFGADPDILDRSIRVNGKPHTVIGVMPPGFQVPSPSWHYNPPQELWTPFPLSQQNTDRGSHSYPVIGRLRDGISVETAQENMSALCLRLSEQYPETNEELYAWVVPIHHAMYGSVGVLMLLIFGAAGWVLLIACGNVASLQLARATGRRTEIAVRAALGAGRGRVVRQLLTESSFLSLLGGAAGVLLAIWSLGLFRSLIPPTIPRSDQIAVDGPVLLFALGLSLLTGIVFGLAPALAVSQMNLTDSLREGGGRRRAGNPGKEKLRTAFVVGQFALCLILLNGGFLLLRSWIALRDTETGFQKENVLTMALSLGGDRFDSEWERSLFVEDVLAAVSTLPGVDAVGAATKLPLLGGNNWYARADHEPPRERPHDGRLVEVSAFLPDYHVAMGIPLLAGRMLTSTDTVTGEQNVVINKTMADRFWPDQDPLGRRFTFFEDPPIWQTVVGVVGDVRQWGLEYRPLPEMYSHYAAGGWDQIFLTLGTTVDPATLVSTARARVLDVDPEQPVSEIRTMEQIIATSLERRSFFALMTGIMALIAMTLATAGVYGVISYYVVQRTHEIGVRIAMGAARGRVLGLVVRRGVKLAAYGLVFGVAGALASGIIVASFLAGVNLLDPMALSSTSLLLTAVAILGSSVPAIRAMRVPPITALGRE